MRIFLLTVLSLGVFSFLQRHAVFPDPDVFYHVKTAILLRDGFWPNAFPWLPWTTLAHGFSEQHLLYHLFLIPFVTFFSPLIGVKIASVLLASGAILTFYFLCRALFPRFALLASFLLVTSYPFLFRMSLGKAQPLALLLLFLFLLALLDRRPVFLFLLSFFAIWTHGSWPLFLLFAVIFFILSWRNGSPRLLSNVFLGALAGLLIHPSFPNTITFLWNQTIRIALVGVSVRGAGMEWYPPDFLDIIASAPLHVLLFLLSFLFLLFVLEKKTLRPASLIFFLLSSISVFLFLRSQRHVEFALPLLTLSFFSLLADLLQEQKLFPAVRGLLRSAFPGLWMRRVAVGFSLLAILTIVVRGVSVADASLREGRPMNHLSRVSSWMREQVPEGTMIVTSNWDIFPELFLFDETHTYPAGLDPRFLRFGNQDRWTAWVRLLSDESESIGVILRDDLGSRYLLIVHERNGALLDRARKDESLRTVYHDDEASVFEIL